MAASSLRPRNFTIWPFILIGVGIVWLLSEAGVVSGANLSVLFRFWPVILIAIGVELLFGRQSRGLTMLIGIGTLVLLLGLMVVGPSLGLATNAEVRQESFQVPLDNVESAQIEVRANVGTVTVRPLTDSSALFDADIRYMGDVTLSSSDRGRERRVVLNNLTEQGFQWLPFVPFMRDDSLRWDIGVNASIPTDLMINTGTGTAELDLSALQLTALNVNTGTGSVNLTLPALTESFNAVVATGTGGATITIPDGTSVNLRVSSGTGGVDINVPDNAAVRLQGSVGTGGISVPAWMRQVSGDNRNFIGADGTWQTEGFDTAEQQIIIQFSGGTGGLEIR